MSNFRKLFLTIALSCFVLVTYQASAVGTYITELPFKGTYRVSCGYHTDCSTPPTAGFGLDFVHNTLPTSGKTAYASGRGVVSRAEEHPSWGRTVVISHPDLYRSRYAHLRWWFPSINHKMREGSPVGYMGNTGCGTCGAHLHWQVYYNTDTGQGVEPIPVDGVVASFCVDCTYTNNGFATDMRLVDNTDAGFSLTGSAACWGNQTNGYHEGGLDQTGIYYFSYCRGRTGSPTKTGTWTPILPSAGNYHIYVFVPEHSGLVLTGYAYYQIYSNNTFLETVTVNQHTYANKWVRLGVFNLSTSGSYVRLTNQTGDAGLPAYDAVMLVKDF